jgi:hypothetical protein
MSVHDPAAELTAAMYSTLRTRWKSLEDAKRTGDTGTINAAQSALNLTLDACSNALGEPTEPRPAVLFKLEYPD